jgi:cation diffusion facilitator family transporter
MATVAMSASLGVAVLMLAGKLTAYALTDSASIFSDAAESVVHIFATGIAAFSLWYSRRPADRNHPYGHGKIAYFSAGFEGALIFVAGITVIGLAVWGFFNRPELQNLGTGMLIILAMGLVNLALGLFLLRAGRRHNSIVLVANGKHVLTDMWTSLGVVAGVGIVHLTGRIWIDSALALVLGLHIVREAWLLVRKSFAGLLDEVDSEKSARIVDTLQQCVAEGVIDQFHQLRHRISNDILWVEVHALLPSDMSNAECHRRATEVEKRVADSFPNYGVHMTVHIEPEDHADHHPDGHELSSPLTGKDPN